MGNSQVVACPSKLLRTTKIVLWIICIVVYISYTYFIHHTQTVCMHHIHTNRAYTHCIDQYIQMIYIECIQYSHKNTIYIKYTHCVHITYITLYSSEIYCIITCTMYSSHTHFKRHINIVYIIYTLCTSQTHTVYIEYTLYTPHINTGIVTYTLYTSHKHCIHYIQTLYISNKH